MILRFLASRWAVSQLLIGRQDCRTCEHGKPTQYCGAFPSRAYNALSVRNKSHKPRPGDRCPHCADGVLTVSPSGEQLMWEECGRIVVYGEPKPENQREP